MSQATQIKFIHDSEKPVLWNRIQSTTNSGDIERILEKDFRYIKAALDTDETIISRDAEARTAYSDVAATIIEIRGIIWVNPCNRNHRPFHWISCGANATTNLQLGP